VKEKEELMGKVHYKKLEKFPGELSRSPIKQGSRRYLQTKTKVFDESLPQLGHIHAHV
jgi:hypothetical protein